MRLTTLTITLLIAIAPTIAGQTPAGDEKQIRDLIAKWDAGQRDDLGTTDLIFWSGAIKKPVIGNAPIEQSTGERPLSRRASTTVKTTPVRIEVSKSGDLAYEFSNGDLTIVMNDGKKSTTPTSILRVWKKEAGQWKVAAHFARPHEQ